MAVSCRSLAALVAALLFLAAPVQAQEPQTHGEARGQPAAGSPAADHAPTGHRTTAAPSSPESDGFGALPADHSSSHAITLPDGRQLHFTATAGKIRLFNAASGKPLADVAYISYTLDGADPAKRPVTFAFNGGPGYASGWLNLGGLGPWRLDMSGRAAHPSAPPVLMDNADTWLGFTDLVFIDPPGTGYSRILGGDDVRKSFWSVKGDVDANAVVIRRWVEEHNRLVSPKYIVGESYGGFRAPKIAAKLDTEQGIGVSGLVLISPVLDFGRFNANYSPLMDVARLPSETAVARQDAKGSVTRADLADVEAYAKGDYLRDLMKGVHDPDLLDRMSARVASFIGLPPAFVRELAGRVSARAFLREKYRETAKIGSHYDGTVTGYDADPFSLTGHAEDQLRVGLHAPITEAMVELYRNRLGWKVPHGRYQFFNEPAAQQWDYGRGDAESVSDLQNVLALDPQMHVLVAHGLTDLVTPYFETAMLLDQIPSYGDVDRIIFKTYDAGHMIYIRDAARKALMQDARAMIEPK